METLDISTPGITIQQLILHFLDHHSSHVIADNEIYQVKRSNCQNNDPNTIYLFVEQVNNDYGYKVPITVTIEYEPKPTIWITLYESRTIKIDKKHWHNPTCLTICKPPIEPPLDDNIRNLITNKFRLITKKVRSIDEYR